LKRFIKKSMQPLFDVAVIGTSAGGIEALSEILSRLDEDFSLPLAIVMHRNESSDGLAAVLQESCALPVLEPEDKCALRDGAVFIAPPGYHLLLEKRWFALSVDDPVHFSRPSIDVLFESAADSFGSKVIGIILTGASKDGAKGLAAVKRLHGYTIVQNPETAQSRFMPGAALDLVVADQVLDLPEIADLLNAIDEERRRGFSHGANRKSKHLNC
jgi:two-component system, chemotaxis family, protein-glutamate methylesterase/glutaminase